MTDLGSRLRARIRIDNPSGGDEDSDKLDRIRELSLAMAQDDGLWFEAQTASEAYLQQELRRLMREIEE